jgi:hypothetical protein
VKARRVVIELIRGERSSEPYSFDGKATRYIRNGIDGRIGEAVMPWPDLATDLELVGRRPSGSEQAGARRRVGHQLRSFLEEVLSTSTGWYEIESAIQEVKASPRRRLHVVFRFGAVELFSLPWALTELREGGMLGQVERCVLQYEWAGTEAAVSSSMKPARLLFAWSSRGHGIPSAQHRQVLREAWPGWNGQEDELPDATLDTLQTKLQAASDSPRGPFHALHVLCHGRPSGLFWEDDQRVVPGDLLRGVLEPHARHLKLAMICACESSHPGPVGNMFGGVAHDLHRMGIPAVIASQAPLSSDGSVGMAHAFYETFRGGEVPVQEAFLHARRKLEPSTLDWSSLQLFAPSETQPLELGKRTVFAPGVSLPASAAEELVVTYEVIMNVPATPVMETLQVLDASKVDTVALRPLGRVAQDLPGTDEDWTRARDEAAQLVTALAAREMELSSRSMLHLFGCAPLPLMFHLGSCLGRRPLRVYQQARREDVWSLGFDSRVVADDGERFFQFDSWPEAAACQAAGGRVGLTVEVTGRMGKGVLSKSFRHEGIPIPLVRLSTARGPPSKTAVRDLMDMARAAAEFTEYLERIHKELPDVREVWLAFWCPGSMAAALGRDYHVKDWPALELLTHTKAGGYQRVFRIGGK